MKVSDLINGVRQAGLIIERILISPDGSVTVDVAPVPRARTVAESSASNKRVGRPPKNGRRRRRGRPRKTEAV
jgi:hypothetical protein